MTELFYNFIVGGHNRGYSYLRQSPAQLYSVTRFLDENNEPFTSVFRVRLDSDKVLACKHGDRNWLDLSAYPPDHLPSCAYPLLLPRVTDEALTYVQISADDGSTIGLTELRAEHSEIVETQGGSTHRRFSMAGPVPVRIDWGGAISHLCNSAEESVAGTRVTFTTEP